VPQHDNIRARVTMLVVVILALVGMLLGACGPQKRNPDVRPFPKPESIAEYNKKRRNMHPRWHQLGQVRCFGGGIGGCSMGGRAYDGPTGTN
jgi:hypothetical protein